MVGCHAFRKRVAKSGLRGLPQQPEALLEELERLVGVEAREATQHRLHVLEDDLRITFQALFKNARGAVEGPSARYALHRLFNQRHGWHIRGLNSGPWNEESMAAMGERVPQAMREIFEDRLGTYGLTLHELAVLAATMESMFEKDVEQRLKVVYEEEQLAPEEKLDFTEANQIMWSYVAVFVMGQVEDVAPGDVRKAVRQFPLRFPRHREARTLLNRIRDEVAGGAKHFDFLLIHRIMSKFGQSLGALEDTECQVMKKKLASLEHDVGSGLVRLGDFYGDQAEQFEHFTEGVDFLRSRGVLDESADDPKVMIPNYLASPSNCVQPAGYYSICCFDECEALMDQVEKHVAAPTSTPEKIVSVVSQLSSASVVANRTLAPRLLGLLDDVAVHHGGVIPLHGRLFAQWMHHAFPRECSYPAADRADAVEVNHFKEEDKQKYMQIAKQQEGTHTTTTSTRWIMKEELVDPKALEMHLRSGRSDVAVFGALGFLGMTTAKLILGPRLDKKKLI